MLTISTFYYLRDIAWPVSGSLDVIAVSYTHLRAHETDSLSRMPSSA